MYRNNFGQSVQICCKEKEREENNTQAVAKRYDLTFKHNK